MERYKQEAEYVSQGRNGGSLDNLKGHPDKGTYSQGGTASTLSDICKLNIDHSNDWREKNSSSDPYQGPCTGKGKNRFVIGQKWGPKVDEVNAEHKDVLFPPRRLDMCTSNLENLGQNDKTPTFLNNVSVNDSFTGDVLLAAKEEAQNILLLYGDKNDYPGMCRVVRASFADLGDIIRGTDIWSGNTDMERLQKHLVTIFKNIHSSLGINVSKYTNSDGKYTTLRSDWWTANRSQVWDAIKCVVQDLFAASDIKSGPGGISSSVSAYCGYNTEVPLDDYIPQKLRWMTEWTENYCKQLYRHHKDVKD
ncbi:erythrocyte membrane protein 1 (PfEMP1), truncated, putative [Plasmodium gaboni]|uniref:Erythrocyte membrane protein 1 (PfEMP1), truncated, putative n=1 Tax=Plasmodium gaboni TaxID=647221 RepID=A0ABY1UVD0_9APIC|nr:erythrocyte membrane protein 1 (PfEMP1), truncated, putative [Plasmodium gaboni]